MKLYVKDSKGSNQSRFLIYDEFSNLKYKVAINKTSLTIKLDVFDINSNSRVAKIRKRDILFLKTYTVSCKENKINEFVSVKLRKSIIMEHKRKINNGENYYEIDINDQNNELLCVCIALCIEILNVDTEFYSERLSKNKITFKREATPQNCFKVKTNKKN